MSSEGKKKRPRLVEAIAAVRQFFEEQCGARCLAIWYVTEAIEDLAKGAYVIHCVERCLQDSTARAHVVWVDLETGELTHTHRVELPPGFEGLPPIRWSGERK